MASTGLKTYLNQFPNWGAGSTPPDPWLVGMGLVALFQEPHLASTLRVSLAPPRNTPEKIDLRP